jgi:uncharacterized protein VirK/YbjX
MDGREPRPAHVLWLEALRRRWSLRLACGERSWHTAWRLLHWLRPGQTRWLRTVDEGEAMRRAAQVDPRLYERWHRPCIAARFGPAARRRVVAAHYDFVQRHFPARLRDRVLRGHDVRLATLRPEGGAAVHLHLRKPVRAGAGELALLLLSDEREPLAACALTFGGEEGLLVGALPDSSLRLDSAAAAGFLRASHGLPPRELLLSLLRELAAWHHLPCVQLDTSGAREAPGAPDRRAARRQREAFRRDACRAFLDAFRDPLRLPARAPAASSAGPPRRAAGLLAAG